MKKNLLKKFLCVTLVFAMVCGMSISIMAAENTTSGNTTSGNTTSVETTPSVPETTPVEEVTPSIPETTPVVEETPVVESAPAVVPEPVVVSEPTASTIANPAAAATYQQAVKSVVANVQEVAKKISSGALPTNQVASINLGRYHSLSASVMSEVSKANVDVELVYIYNGKKYTVVIPKGYKFDDSVEWYGPLYMFSLFGKTIE